MKKVFGIVLALALVLTATVASVVPAGAVAPPITVCLDNPIASQNSTYYILFHNMSLLKAADDDFIDLMFPNGTNVNGATVMSVVHGTIPPTIPATCGPCTGITYTGATATSGTYQAATIKSLRITLTSGIIDKCQWVLITVANVTNPLSCNHHLEVGTSTHTPVDSEDYTIYCAKIDLQGGVTATGAAVMNLVSLPCYPIDTSIEAVLQDLLCYVAATATSQKPFSFQVWYWDNVAKKWLKYCSDSSFADLQTMEPGKAYWVKPSANFPLYIHGNPYPPGQGPPVKWCYPFSWNMVGYASLATGKTLGAYLQYTVIPPMYDWAVIAVWYFDTSSQAYKDTGWRQNSSSTDPAGTGYNFIMTPGMGYWMAFKGEGCIIPPAPGM